MSLFTAGELADQTAAWKQALLKLGSGAVQEYAIGSRRLRYADLPEIRKTLEFLNAQKSNISGGSRRVHATPVSSTW